MEDLEIEPGICATRIRCYTEGAMQRPATVRNQTTVRETLYRSASSLLVTRPAGMPQGPSPPARRELCRSCDQLPTRESVARTFVSSVNIALTKPEVARKLSLPAPPYGVRSRTLQPALRQATSSGCLRGEGSCSEVGGPIECGTSGGHLDGSGLPWDTSDDFPHVPVLERIKEFERQTGGLHCRSPTPGKWKKKGKAHWCKTSGSAHSSSTAPHQDQLDDKVSIRNSRNSTATILRLHTKLPNAKPCSKGTPRGKASDRAFPKIVLTSDARAPTDQTTSTSPKAVSCRLDDCPKVVVKQTSPDDPWPVGHSSNSCPATVRTDKTLEASSAVDASLSAASCCPGGSLASLQSSTPGEQDPCESNSGEPTPLVPSEPVKTPEQGCHGSQKDRTEEVALDTRTATLGLEAIDVARADARTETSSESALSIDPLEGTDQDLENHCESGLPAEGCAPAPAFECARNGISEGPTVQETREATADVARATEELSGKLSCHTSVDGQSATDVPCAPVDSSCEGGAESETPPQDTECNSPEATLTECITAPTRHFDVDSQELLLPSQPWMDEIFQAGQGMDTDVYSQRCSLQLGESGCPLAALQQASPGGEDPAAGLLGGSASPCLSDCYSRSNSNSSSDDETPPAHGQLLTDLLQRSGVGCSVEASSESAVWNTRTGVPPLAVPEEFLDPVASAEVSTSEANQGDELRHPDEVENYKAPLAEEATSEQSTDDSSTSTSDSDPLESLKCIQEVLASEHLPDLSASLGACGGAAAGGPVAAQDSGAALTSANRSAFSRHLSALIAGQRRQRARSGGNAAAAPLNADQALFLSRVNLILAWIHNQQLQPGPLSSSSSSLLALPAANETGTPSDPPSDCSSSSGASGIDASPSRPEGSEDDSNTKPSEPVVYRTETREERIQLLKRPKRRRRKKFIDPDKVSHLRFLILQSPLVLSDGEDSGSSDESDVELNEFGEVKQDYPLGRLPDYIVAQIFSNLPTRDLAALKCACKDFKWLIERFDIKSTDSKWSESSLYREDPCMQCGKIRDPRGDVSLCRWHPKIYYKNGEIGRHYWTCCFASEEEAPGCETSLHDNKWSGSHSRLCKVPRSWRQYWRSYPVDS